MVAIIDDREDVWGRCPNLVHVKPYVFFSGTSDINAPPPLVPPSPSSSSSLPSTPTTPRPFFSGASQGSGVVPHGQPRPFKMRHISRQPRPRPSGTRQQPASDLTTHSHTAKGNGTPPSDHPQSSPLDSGHTEHEPSHSPGDLKACGSSRSNDDVSSVGSPNDRRSNDRDVSYEHLNVNSNNNNSKERDGSDSGESGSDKEEDEGGDGGRGEGGGGGGVEGESSGKVEGGDGGRGEGGRSEGVEGESSGKVGSENGGRGEGVEGGKMEGEGGNGVSSSSSSGSSSDSEDSSSSGSSSAMDDSQPQPALETGATVAEVAADSEEIVPAENEENGMPQKAYMLETE